MDLHQLLHYLNLHHLLSKASIESINSQIIVPGACEAAAEVTIQGFRALRSPPRGPATFNTVLYCSRMASLRIVEAIPGSFQVVGANEVDVAAAVASRINFANSVTSGILRNDTAHLCACPKKRGSIARQQWICGSFGSDEPMMVVHFAKWDLCVGIILVDDVPERPRKKSQERFRTDAGSDD